MIDPEDLITAEEAARELGLPVSYLTVWRKTRRGGPPWTRYSAKVVRYSRRAVREYLRTCFVVPALKQA